MTRKDATAMSDHRPAAARSAKAFDLDDHTAALRHLGGRAHQLRAATQAADHFNASDEPTDHNTACWLISGALMLADEVALDLDALARGMKERPVDAALRGTVAQLRVRAHQLHAAARAADHYMEQDTREDHETGTWLIANAMGLAQRLAGELDDCAVPVRRPQVEGIEPHDAALVRRVAAAAQVRGAA